MSAFKVRAHLSLLLLVLCDASLLYAQEAGRPSGDERAKHLARMRAVASSITLLAEAGREASVVKLVDEPILRYTDDTRKNSESSLWIWSGGGRPAAVLAVELYPKPPRGPRWLVEIASLADQRIAARHDTDLNWTGRSPGLVCQTLADVDPPAATAPRRLTQMKSLFRTFTAHESAVIEGRIQLRQLTSPLHRYSQADAGILDGAIFAFANGTNPEVLAVLEAHAAGDAKPRWRCSFAQMTGGAVTILQGDKEIWSCTEADPPAARDTYVNGWLSAKPAAE